MGLFRKEKSVESLVPGLRTIIHFEKRQNLNQSMRCPHRSAALLPRTPCARTRMDAPDTAGPSSCCNCPTRRPRNRLRPRGAVSGLHAPSCPGRGRTEERARAWGRGQSQSPGRRPEPLGAMIRRWREAYLVGRRAERWRQRTRRKHSSSRGQVQSCALRTRAAQPCPQALLPGDSHTGLPETGLCC